MYSLTYLYVLYKIFQAPIQIILDKNGIIGDNKLYLRNYIQIATLIL